MSKRILFTGGWGAALAHQTAQWMGGALDPVLVILHDTASRIEEGNAAAYLARNQAKVSVHFVVERDGSVVQQVPLDRVAYHAGQSSYHGRASCNGFSIGIEIVNPGRLSAIGGGKARSWFKEDFDIGAYGIQEVTTPEHGHGLWMDYPAVQVEAVMTLLDSLFDHLPRLLDIRTHWYVSPGRKMDTNPLFPLESIRARVLGRDDPALGEADAASAPEGNERMVEVATFGDTLNLRAWPSFNPNILAAIPASTEVPVLREGVFDGRPWLKVLYGGREGWVLARYTRPVT